MKIDKQRVKFKVWQRVRTTQPILVTSHDRDKAIPAGAMGTVRRRVAGNAPVYSYGVELDAVRDDPWNRGLTTIEFNVRTPDERIVNILDIIELAPTTEETRV